MKWYWILAIVIGAAAVGYGLSMAIGGKKEEVADVKDQGDGTAVVTTTDGTKKRVALRA